MSYWTIEEVAEFLDITVGQVRESRRRKEYPGNIGTQRGRRLLFDVERVQAGPDTPETTSDAVVALLWTAQGIEAKLGELVEMNRAQIRSRLARAESEPAYPPGYDPDDLRKRGRR